MVELTKENLNKFITIGSIVVALIVVTFLLLIFIPKPLCYFNIDDFTEVKALQDSQDSDCLSLEIKELLAVDKCVMIYENDELCLNPNEIPYMYELVRSLPDVERCFCFRIDPKTLPTKHKGAAPFANKTLRVFLPIVVSGCRKSAIWCDGETKFFEALNPIIFDDSRENAVYNEHKRLPSYVLCVDFTRPPHIPIGISELKEPELY
jgi:hypothetical protein